MTCIFMWSEAKCAYSEIVTSSHKAAESWTNSQDHINQKAQLTRLQNSHMIKIRLATDVI